MPIAVSDGFHCSDLGTANGVADETVGRVQREALAKMQAWLAEWEPSSRSRGRKRGERGRGEVMEMRSEKREVKLRKPINAWLRDPAVLGS